MDRATDNDPVVMLLNVEVTRWVSDEPQPGVVRLEFIDIFGKTHALTDKCSVVDAGNQLWRVARYPVDVRMQCRVHRNELHGRQGVSRRDWIDLSPRGLSGPEELYAVNREALTWDRPAELGDLSIAARQALALVTSANGGMP